MPHFQAGVLIKQLRINKGLTQSQLCEGICTKDVLSRIERGLRRPIWHSFERIMQRLGESPDKYYDGIATTKDRRIVEIKDKLKQLLREKSSESRSESEKLINKLEESKDFKSGINLQFLLRSKATLAFQRKDYVSAYNFATEAVKISKEQFNEENIDTYILSFDEIWAINQIASAASFTVSIEKSTEILLKLKTSIDKGYIDGDEKAKTYLSLLYNISKNHGLLKRNADCVEICDEGIKLCRIHQDAFHYPLFLFNKAVSLLYLNQEKQGIQLLKQTVALLEGYERYSELEKVIEFVEEEFDLKIQIQNSITRNC